MRSMPAASNRACLMVGRWVKVPPRRKSDRQLGGHQDPIQRLNTAPEPPGDWLLNLKTVYAPICVPH